MSATGPGPLATELSARLDRDGFVFVEGATLRNALISGNGLADWSEFARSWDRLGPDPHLAALGLRRRRRHAVFSVEPEHAIVQLPPRPHYQHLEHNPLQGGIERWFDPIEPAVASGPSLHTLIRFGDRVFSSLAGPAPQWLVEAHQFRIEAGCGHPGQPTPEGPHRDGVDYVLVVLIDRVNIASGVTSTYSADGTELGAFTLSQPFDSALVDDRRALHGVTPVFALEHGAPAHRDVVVITYRRAALPVDSTFP